MVIQMFIQALIQTYHQYHQIMTLLYLQKQSKQVLMLLTQRLRLVLILDQMIMSQLVLTLLTSLEPQMKLRQQ